MKIDKTAAEWRREFSPERYRVLREKGTEPMFSSPLDANFEPGKYTCAGCGAELFDDKTKFEASCGWPSFYAARPDAVEFHQDDSHGMSRVEVTCATCGGHLGHVFEGEGFDTPTDKRFCINGLSLQFKAGN